MQHEPQKLSKQEISTALSYLQHFSGELDASKMTPEARDKFYHWVAETKKLLEKNEVTQDEVDARKAELREILEEGTKEDEPTTTEGTPRTIARFRILMRCLVIMSILAIVLGVWYAIYVFVAAGAVLLIMIFVLRGKNNFASVVHSKIRFNPFRSRRILHNGKWQETQPYFWQTMRAMFKTVMSESKKRKQ